MSSHSSELHAQGLLTTASLAHLDRERHLKAPETTLRSDRREWGEVHRALGVPYPHTDQRIPNKNTRNPEQRRTARRRSVGRGLLETVNRTISSVVGCYMAEPGWLGDIEIEVVEAALSLPGLDQTPP